MSSANCPNKYVEPQAALRIGLLPGGDILNLLPIMGQCEAFLLIEPSLIDFRKIFSLGYGWEKYLPFPSA